MCQCKKMSESFLLYLQVRKFRSPVCSGLTMNFSLRVHRKMSVPAKAPWFLFSTFVVLFLAVTTPATSKDARRSGKIHRKHGIYICYKEK